jgi:3-oxoacyl-[acyl-carrier protein] reductase
VKLQNRVAIVTGAGRGIGRAIAVGLAQEGARVVVNYSRSADAAAEVVKMIEEAGGEALAVQGDVAHADQVDALLNATLERFGRVDILINNAGITRDKLILRMTEEDWDTVLDTNLKGAFLCARAVAPRMLKQKSGVIVNVGSVVGKVGGAGQVNYSASKAGLIGLTKSLAKELGSRNIRVNAVAPGFIETDMTQVMKAEQRESVIKQVPLGRLGQGKDIANVVTFLCTDGAAYIQGEVISVDGGLFM